jgi:hypothetical protein
MERLCTGFDIIKDHFHTSNQQRKKLISKNLEKQSKRAFSEFLIISYFYRVVLGKLPKNIECIGCVKNHSFNAP